VNRAPHGSALSGGQGDLIQGTGFSQKQCGNKEF
jgi:hypothetical protein